MRILVVALVLLGFVVNAIPAEAGRSRRARQAGYYDTDGNYIRSSPNGDYNSRGQWVRKERKIRAHRRRRNVLLGVGALGLITGSGTLTGVGLGGAAANHVIDDENRDY